MKESNYNFPVFKKRFDGKAFYKIESNQFFIEIQLLGERYLVYEHEVKIYPDQLLLKDILSKSDFYLESEEEEFEAQKKGII